MKTKILTVFLFIIMVLLMVGLVTVGVTIYSDFIEGKPENVIYKIDKIATEEPENTNRIQPSGDLSSLNIESTQKNINVDNTQSERTYIPSETSGGRFFYNQLTDEQKNIYARTSKQ